MSELYNVSIVSEQVGNLKKKKSHLHIMFKTSKHKSQSIIFPHGY